MTARRRATAQPPRVTPPTPAGPRCLLCGGPSTVRRSIAVGDSRALVGACAPCDHALDAGDLVVVERWDRAARRALSPRVVA